MQKQQSNVLVKIRRISQWYGEVRDYKIFLDTKKTEVVGKVRINQFTIPEGEHQFFAKNDWFETKKVSLNLEKDEVKEIILKSSQRSKTDDPVHFHSAVSGLSD